MDIRKFLPIKRSAEDNSELPPPKKSPGCDIKNDDNDDNDKPDKKFLIASMYLIIIYLL